MVAGSQVAAVPQKAVTSSELDRSASAELAETSCRNTTTIARRKQPEVMGLFVSAVLGLGGPGKNETGRSW